MVCVCSTCVYAGVLLQLARGGEPLRTDGADEWLLSRVGAHVSRHVVPGKPATNGYVLLQVKSVGQSAYELITFFMLLCICVAELVNVSSSHPVAAGSIVC